MPWNLTLQRDSTPPFLDVRFAGAIVATDLSAAVDTISTYVGQLEPLLVLADCSDLLVDHSVFDLHALADRVVAGPRSRMFREAVILPTDAVDASYVEFWETACFNRGLDVRTFRDRLSALAWLLA